MAYTERMTTRVAVPTLSVALCCLTLACGDKSAPPPPAPPAPEAEAPASPNAEDAAGSASNPVAGPASNPAATTEMDQAMQDMSQAMAEGLQQMGEAMGEMMLVMAELGPQLDGLTENYDLESPEDMRAAADDIGAGAALVRDRAESASPEVRKMLEEMAQEMEALAQLAREDPEAAIRRRQENMATGPGGGMSLPGPGGSAEAGSAPLPAAVQAEFDAFEAETEARITAVARANDLTTPGGVDALATEIETMATELETRAAGADPAAQDAWRQLADRLSALASRVRANPDAGPNLARTLLGADAPAEE